MPQFGLIGKSLSHSFSKQYFEKKFKQNELKANTYTFFELTDVSEIKNLVASNPQLAGLNVTIPYKQTILQFLDEIDGKASEIGAVNTILIKDNKLKGYNTDYDGFKTSFTNFVKDFTHHKALILGSGGASKAVQKVLSDLGVSYQIVSRQKTEKTISYDDLDAIWLKNFKIIINTTPLGMHPNITEYPSIPYEYMSENHYVMDLIYNPEQTLFLQKSAEKGAFVRNGLEMLEIQAEKSWKIWNS